MTKRVSLTVRRLKDDPELARRFTKWLMHQRMNYKLIMGSRYTPELGEKMRNHTNNIKRKIQKDGISLLFVYKEVCLQFSIVGDSFTMTPKKSTAGRSRLIHKMLTILRPGIYKPVYWKW